MDRQQKVKRDSSRAWFMAVGVVALLALVMVAASACGGSDVASTATTAGPAATETSQEIDKTMTTTTAPTITTAPTTTTRREIFTVENWSVLDTNPGGHKGASVDIVGQVFATVERDAHGTYWQMWADPRNSEWNTSVLYSNPDFRIKDQDYVHVVGFVHDVFEGENAFGGLVTAPVVVATSAEVVDATATAPEALRTVEVHLTQKQHGLAITVSKVEFAAEETRVYVTVENGSGDEATFYSFNAKAVQGSTQYEPESWGTDYPEVQSDILPGISTSGVIVFEAMDPSTPTKIYLEGRAGSYSLDFDPYVFTIPGE
jgi:hypothetical protein